MGTSLANLESVPAVEPIDLSVLAIVGLSRNEPRVDRICQRVMGGHIQKQRGAGSYIGIILGSLIRKGYADDPCIGPLISAILREQRFLDGN